jgi:hypothetical protein
VSVFGVRAEGPFPELVLKDAGGKPHPLSEAWRGGEALFLIGHAECSTTRQAIPCVDRIHRRKTRGAVVLVLQDDAETAARLVSELGLELPVRLEADPYPLAQALDLAVVPALVLVGPQGAIERVSVGFRRANLEAFAERFGVPGPLFAAADRAPAFRPG